MNREAGPVNYGNSTLVLNGAGTYTFGGYLRNVTGTLGLVKNGAGTQILSGSQITHTGPTRVNAGTLSLLNTTGYASAATVASGAILELANTANTGIGTGALFTLESGATLVHNGQTQGNAYTTLAGGVTLTNSAGYRIATDRLDMALDRTHLESGGAVTAEAPFGRIQAGTLVLTRDAQGDYKLDFTGGVRLLYQPAQQEVSP